MTYDEITLWRRWMRGKGTLNNFEYLYKSHRFDKRSLDEYLEDVSAEDVILSAFDFSGAGNTIFSFKYWKDLDSKWQLRLREFRDNGDMIEAQTVVCINCKRQLPRSAFAMTNKGLLHKHCKECESGEWARQKREAEKQKKDKERLEKEIAQKQAELERIKAEQEAAQETAPTPGMTIIDSMRDNFRKQEIAAAQADINKTTKVCEHCGKRKLKSEFPENSAKPDGLDAWCKKCQDAASNVSAQADFLMERKERIQTMIDAAPKPAEPAAVKPTFAAPVKPDRLSAPRLGEHDATLHYKKGQKSITFNSVLSQQIRDGEYTKCYLNPDRQMRQFLIFNRMEGANITGASNLAQSLLNVNSAEIVRALAARFGLEEGDNYYLHITKNLASKADVITVEVLLARTREEYARLAEKREEATKKGLDVPGEDIPEYENYTINDGQEENTAVATAVNGAGSKPEDAPILEFPDTTEMFAGLSSPQEVLQAVIDRGLATEHDIAAFLFHKGWELHEPVVVTKHKKFSL